MQFIIFLALLAVAGPFVLFVVLLITRDDLRKLRATVNGLTAEKGELAELRARVARLEGRRADRRSEVLAPPAITEAASAAEVSKTAEPPAPVIEVAPPSRWDDADRGGRVVTPAAGKPSARRRPAQSTRTWADRAFGGADWEAVIGGNWLNKLGALVLVVGIALLLAYSVAHLGPLGRVALGLSMSISMLIAGIALQRRERYRIPAEGLLGGGWAGLYFTTYAMHGLEAARVIDNPAIGTMLLLVVAVGMVLHSLHYRSQAITGLAYFIVFATLAISPLSRFALVAGIPVVASLLYVAQRFRWERMAVAGLVLSYGAFVLRYNGLQAVGAAEVDWAFGQGLILAYWLVFEAFDILSLVRGRTDEIAYTLFPLNSAGFLGISILEWNTASPQNLFTFFAIAGVAYLISAGLRGRYIDAPAREDGVAFRPESITYEGATALAAALFAFGIYLRFDGWQMTVAWLLEAQMLILAGLQLRQRFLRRLGSAVVLLPALRVVGVDLASARHLDIAGRAVRLGTPVALLASAVLFGDRALLRRTRTARAAGAEHLYTYAASFILTLVIGFEAPLELAPLGWIFLSVVLFESAVRSGLGELRYQAYAIGGVAWIQILAATVLGLAPAPDRVWILLAPAAVFGYGTAVRMFGRPEGMGDAERQRVFDVAGLLGSVAVATWIWHMAPAALVAVGWLLLGVALVEVGFGAQERSLRAWGHAALLLSFVRALTANLMDVGETLGVSHRLLTMLPMIAAYYYVALRLREARGRDARLRVESLLERAYLYLPAILATALIRFELGRSPAVIGWMILGLSLLVLGQRRNVADLRFQSYVLAFVVFARAWATNFYLPGTILGVPGRLLAGFIVIAGLLASYVLVRRRREISTRRGGSGFDALIEWLAERAYGALSLMATVLAAVLLSLELGAAATATGWMVLCLVLLGAGLRWKLDELRLQAYGLAIVVFARAWMIDFHVDATVLGVPGLLFTGIAISLGLFAAHFMLRRHPVSVEGGSHGQFGALVAWADAHAANVMSLLGTVFLAGFLFYQVSGSLLTIAWGLQGTALLLAGFGLRDRQLRLSGLVLLGVCILKAFFYDFRELETVFRIFSFIVLGSLLIAVSLVYSRHREQLRKLL